MFDKMATAFANNNIIAPEEKELYAYGLQEGFLMIWNMLTTVMLGMMFHLVWESIIYMVAYIPVRVYAGGYHAKTQLRCYFFSIGMTVLSLAVIKWITWSYIICFIMSALSGGIIFMLSPVEDANKPLDEIEIKVYRKKARRALFIALGMIILFTIWGKDLPAVSVAVAMATLGIMLVLGKIKNCFEAKKQTE